MKRSHFHIYVYFFVCVHMRERDSPAKLSKDSWGEIGCVAASRVLLFTPVLLLIVHRLQETSRHMSSQSSDSTVST